MNKSMEIAEVCEDILVVSDLVKYGIINISQSNLKQKMSYKSNMKNTIQLIEWVYMVISVMILISILFNNRKNQFVQLLCFFFTNTFNT